MVVIEKKKHRHDGYRKLTVEFLQLYGGKCKVCGQSIPEFLTLDHIKNDGWSIRKETYQWKEYESAVKKYDPETYQILCFNCNLGKNRMQKSTGSSKKSKCRRNVRIKFLNMYGNKCNCPGCEETNPIFLTLDHVKNDGNYRRKQKRTLSNDREYQLAVHQYDPETYQILCFNCNISKNRTMGVCIHFNIINEGD
jgi:hypothetical protein